MPDPNGKLSVEESKLIAKHLDDKGVNHSCPVCNHNNWSIGAHLLNGMVHTPGGVTIGGPTYPMAFIVCGNCAYVRQFMAIPLGILSSDSDGGTSDV